MWQLGMIIRMKFQLSLSMMRTSILFSLSVGRVLSFGSMDVVKIKTVYHLSQGPCQEHPMGMATPSSSHLEAVSPEASEELKDKLFH